MRVPISSRVLETLEHVWPRSLVRKSLRHARGYVAARDAIGALRAEDSRAVRLDEVVDVAFRFDHRSFRIKPYQIRSEIERLLGILQDRRPSTLLQIGTCTGGTLYLLARVAAPDAMLISVDLPHGRFGGGYPAWYAPLYRSFARERQRVTLVLGDSHARRTVERVRRVSRGRPVDFLFIDGDHTYEGVSEDFRRYAPLVSPAGLIAFHDIVPGDEEMVGGVPRFWQEVKKTGPAYEIVEDWHQGSAGIGLLGYGDAALPRPNGTP